MSPYSLIQVGTLHERAGLVSDSHFTLFPAGLRAFLSKLFDRHPPLAIAGEKADGAPGTGTQTSVVPQAVTVAVNLHPLDHASLEEASRAVRMDEAAFCALAIHRASRSVIDNESFRRIV